MAIYPDVLIDTNMADGLCFGCGPNNPAGLHLAFKTDGQKVRAEFVPARHHQGWPDILHGGIISAVLDEAMSYAAKLSVKVECVTAQMSVVFREPVKITQRLEVSSFVTRVSRKILESKAELTLADGTVVAEGRSKQYVVGGTNYHE
ncbi:PaaI family thioesterase [Chloroflexota bacterium]